VRVWFAPSQIVVDEVKDKEFIYTATVAVDEQPALELAVTV